MKKTLTVNLGGTVFHIDEDAYRLLDNYLSNLKIHFRKEAGADEIVDDIERRISELFAEKLSAGSQVITIADVEEHLQAARRLYNANVNTYNTKLVVFPSSIVANNMHAVKKPFFEAEEAKRQDVKMSF